MWQGLVEQIIEGLPLDVHDLSGFAVHLSDIYAEYPELPRLVTWQLLQHGGEPAGAYSVESVRSRIDAIAGAQADGVVSGRFEARVLFMLLIHVAMLWNMASPDVLAAVELTDPGQRREIIRSAAAALLEDGRY
ncbi:hypothetical protein [Streptomyces sp. NPDC056160]|uniref:hypothetical protein n=1 Tax=Streptomyces sp. NPDC056160 TaxID=3345731 RepID=UPI0035DDAF47